MVKNRSKRGQKQQNVTKIKKNWKKPVVNQFFGVLCIAKTTWVQNAGTLANFEVKKISKMVKNGKK